MLLTIGRLLFITFTLIGLSAFGQGIYLLPDPTNVLEPVRLYVDVTSPDCQCQELTDAGPDNPVYLWTWIPNEDRSPITVDGSTVDITNGDWGSSNENMRMTQDENNPNLWYYDFYNLPLTEYYGASPADFYSDGIHFLVKEKNGAPPDEPEQKSADLVIVPESPGCVLQFCTFPTIWFPTDYLIITYDNNQEQIFQLQNLSPSEAFIFYEYRVDGGPLLTYGNEESEAIPLEDMGGGFFSHMMVPNKFLPDVGDGQITELRAVITKNVPVLAAPPFSRETLTVGCPE